MSFSLLGSWLRAMVRGIPTLVALGLLAATLWWGKTHDWKPPQFSAIRGDVSKESEPWCKEHGVPEVICIVCNPDLKPAPRETLSCELHGLPFCPLEHPELAQTDNWLVTEKMQERSGRLVRQYPTKGDPTCDRHLRRVQVASLEAAKKAGIEGFKVIESPFIEFVSAPGSIEYDDTKVVHLASRSHGSVRKVFRRLGDEVKAGDLLALVDAADVGKTKADLLFAYGELGLRRSTLETQRQAAGAIPAARVREAEAAVKESEIRLAAACQALTNLGMPIKDSELRDFSAEEVRNRIRLLGIPTSVAASLEPEIAASSNLLPLMAPTEGTVTSRDVVAGEIVDPTHPLFEIVETRALKMVCDIKGEDAARVVLGQELRFQPDDGGPAASGKISWIATQVDPRTRTVKIRADLADPERKRKANTYGKGQVITREESTLVVPHEAVLSEGCCRIVFVYDKEFETSPYKVFHVRKIRTGSRDAKFTEIVAGLLPGEKVVTQGGSLLLDALLRDQLGEGCACCAKKKK